MCHVLKLETAHCLPGQLRSLLPAMLHADGLPLEGRPGERIQVVTHEDGTRCLQRVGQGSNPPYYPRSSCSMKERLAGVAQHQL